MAMVCDDGDDDESIFVGINAIGSVHEVDYGVALHHPLHLLILPHDHHLFLTLDSGEEKPVVLRMLLHGAGEGLVKWFTTLLSNTFTSASVNEHLSRLVEMRGGTPQGAGQSCGGYLFIPWALDCWLRKCLAVGVKVIEGSEDVRGWYYADDGHIVLKSLDPDVIAAFKDAMHVFALATNQHQDKAPAHWRLA